jgi:hypothetical protein
MVVEIKKFDVRNLKKFKILKKEEMAERLKAADCKSVEFSSS